jgi:hypothetical protein
MSEIYPSNAELNALLEDAETGVEYIPSGTTPYYVHFRKLLYRLLLATKRSNDFRVYKEGGLSFGIKPGKFFNGNELVEYPGSTGNLMQDNKTDKCYYLKPDGTLLYEEAPFWFVSINPRVMLAKMSSFNGEITSLEDQRGFHGFAMPHIPKPFYYAHADSENWYTLHHGLSGGVFTNDGATDTVKFTLPYYEVPGTTFTFCVKEQKILQIYPTGQKIIFDPSTNSGDVNNMVYSGQSGDCISITQIDNGDWVVSARHGTWYQEA